MSLQLVFLRLETSTFLSNHSEYAMEEMTVAISTYLLLR